MVDIFGQIQLRLPYDHSVIGFMRTGDNRMFAAWSRQDELQPFGTCQVSPTGACEHGHYFQTHADAINDLNIRAQGGISDTAALLEAVTAHMEELLNVHGASLVEATAYLQRRESPRA